mmetsp:Transcript_78716/g.130377  ORF Transcript_78716/g.130377 Transcript_78716/m.130377 type:complete len:112 (+) Transcript_78716:287-622(+)
MLVPATSQICQSGLAGRRGPNRAQACGPLGCSDVARHPACPLLHKGNAAPSSAKAQPERVAPTRNTQICLAYDPKVGALQQLPQLVAGAGGGMPPGAGIFTRTSSSVRKLC